MTQFRQGPLNCLFATSIAEEGIDISGCNMVIRFDLCKTLIQYIQSRGRARHANSRYIHLLDRGSQDHERSIYELKDAEIRLRLLCQMQPEDRLIRGNEYDMDYWLGREPHPSYSVSTTGAKLTYKESLRVLDSFVASLPHPLDTTCAAEYTVMSSRKGFICEVILPYASPISRAEGHVARSKQVAKCSAAFEACVRLHKEGCLDDHLRPTLEKHLPGLRNARLALSSKKQAEYHMRVKPDIWSRRGLPSSLFITVFRLSAPDALGRLSQPLAILTREPLPHVAKFPLFFSNQRTSDVVCVPIASFIKPSPSDIEGLGVFTLRVFRDIFSKEYRPEPEKMPYFLAPLLYAHGFDFARDGISPRELIDWACINSVKAVTDGLEWEGQPDQILKDKFVTDPHDGSRKFYTVARRHDLKPTDPQLPSAPKGQRSAKVTREAPKDIWNYSVSLWSKTRAKIPVDLNLPVLEAEFIPLRRNLLDELEMVDNRNLKCYLVLQTMKLSAVSFETHSRGIN